MNLVVTKLDMWLLGKFQQLTNFVYKWIGVSNFDLSRLSLITTDTVLIAGAIGMKNYIWIPLLLLMSWLSWIVLSGKIDRLEKNGMDLLMLATLTIGRLRSLFYWLILTSLLFYSSVILEEPMSLGWRVGAFIFINLSVAQEYFLSCTPPPKRKSKVKELKEAAERKAAEALAPTPELAPN